MTNLEKANEMLETAESLRLSLERYLKSQRPKDYEKSLAITVAIGDLLHKFAPIPGDVILMTMLDFSTATLEHAIKGPIKASWN